MVLRIAGTVGRDEEIYAFVKARNRGSANRGPSAQLQVRVGSFVPPRLRRVILDG